MFIFLFFEVEDETPFVFNCFMYFFSSYLIITTSYIFNTVTAKLTPAQIKNGTFARLIIFHALLLLQDVKTENYLSHLIFFLSKFDVIYCLTKYG